MLTSVLRTRTIGQTFDPRNNSLNLIRLVLAALVIIAHAPPFGGFDDSAWGQLDVLGAMAVDCFFVISGFLIIRSWDQRPKVFRYLWHRALRILPGYWVCLIVTAFVVAPAAFLISHGTIDGFFTASDGPLSYVIDNSLLDVKQPSVSGTPTAVPYAGVWNPSLWTLLWEAACYLLLLALGFIGAVKRRPWMLISVFAIFQVLLISRLVAPSLTDSFMNEEFHQPLRLGSMFFAGAVIYLLRDRIPNSRWLALGAVIALVGAYLIVTIWVVALALAYLMIWGATNVKLGTGLRTDISYGVYIYGAVVQQMLAVLGLNALGLLPYLAISLAAVAPLAALSWFLVEKPALRLKDWSPSFRRSIPGEPATTVPQQRDISDMPESASESARIH